MIDSLSIPCEFTYNNMFSFIASSSLDKQFDAKKFAVMLLEMKAGSKVKFGIDGEKYITTTTVGVGRIRCKTLTELLVPNKTEKQITCTDMKRVAASVIQQLRILLKDADNNKILCVKVTLKVLMTVYKGRPVEVHFFIQLYDGVLEFCASANNVTDLSVASSTSTSTSTSTPSPVVEDLTQSCIDSYISPSPIHVEEVEKPVTDNQPTNFEFTHDQLEMLRKHLADMRANRVSN